jgi:hypothetical protein
MFPSRLYGIQLKGRTTAKDNLHIKERTGSDTMPQSQSARWRRSSYDQRKDSKKVHKSIDVHDAVGIHYSRLGHENKRTAMTFSSNRGEGAGQRLQSRDRHVMLGESENFSVPVV